MKTDSENQTEQVQSFYKTFLNKYIVLSINTGDREFHYKGKVVGITKTSILFFDRRAGHIVFSFDEISSCKISTDPNLASEVEMKMMEDQNGNSSR